MTDNYKNKIGIIGAGAAGLAAGITAGRILTDAQGLKEWKIQIFDSNDEPGKKILATGNGRCNITNIEARDYEVVKGFFNDLGILFAFEEEGRVYPHSKQAKSIRDVLVKSAEKYGVDFQLNKSIKQIKKTDDFFVLTDIDGNEYVFEKVIVASGGKAGIQYGSDGSGLRLLRDFKIKQNPILPALVPMVYDDSQEANLKSLKGVRANVKVTLYVNGKEISNEFGEIQFTQYGLSGICIFNLSRFFVDLPKSNGKLDECYVIIDLVPEYEKQEVKAFLSDNLEAGLEGIVNRKIADFFANSKEFSGGDAEKTANSLKEFQVKISGTKGWKEAQVTSGGIDLKEINPSSMELKNVKNLHLAGEILDYAGPCGGFNLNWAWLTGIQAGLGATNGIHQDD